MSIKRMTTVWDSSAASGGALLLLLAIADIADDNGLAWPGLENLMKRSRLGRRQVIKNVQALEASGELHVHRRSGQHNHYIVLTGLTEAERNEAIHDLTERIGEVTAQSAPVAESAPVSQSAPVHCDTPVPVSQSARVPVSQSARVPVSQSARVPVLESARVPVHSSAPDPSLDTSIEPSIEPSTTSSSASPLTGARAREAGDDDDETAFILDEGTKLGLNDNWRQALAARGPTEAAALLLHVRSRASSSPAGLLITMLRLQQPPPAEALARAALALELRTLDGERLERHLRRQDLERFQTDAMEIAQGVDLEAASARQDQEEKPRLPRDGQDGAGIWQAALGSLRIQLNQNTFETWLQGSAVTRYEDGVMTVRARHIYGARWLAQHLAQDATRIVSDIAGVPVRVEFEGAEVNG